MQKFINSVLIVLVALAVTSCAKGPKVEPGALASINYVGTLKDGSKFDTTEGKQPITFLVGSGQVMKAFEKKILGMHIGSKKKFTIKAKDAYGTPDPKKIIVFPKDQRFAGVDLKPGATIVATNKLPDGKTVQTPVKVVSATDSQVTIDANHPLAGKDLTFEVSVIGIEAPVSKQIGQAATQPQVKVQG